VDVHRDMLGQMAADALHELSCSANPHGREYQIPAKLILGDSSGPAPTQRASLVCLGRSGSSKAI
jgi:DNA-binding LacI/PurR family transcriptional regulator